jgi:hypothetical protein
VRAAASGPLIKSIQRQVSLKLTPRHEAVNISFRSEFRRLNQFCVEMAVAARAIRRPRWRVLLATAVVAAAAVAAGGAIAGHASAPAAHAVADNGVISGN